MSKTRWRIYQTMGQDYPSIVNPNGDAELGTWMIAERVRWLGHAHLIAAAPELYEALDGLLCAVQGSCDGMQFYIDLALAALRSVRGDAATQRREE